MKLSQPIFLIAFLVLVLSCTSENQNNPSGLSITEQEEIILGPYYHYLDSVGRTPQLYYRFAVLEDSSSMESILFVREGKSEHAILYGAVSYDSPVMFEDSLGSSLVERFDLINESYVDSAAGTSLVNPNYERLYAISRPYQPDSCDLVIMQEFEIPRSTGCLPYRSKCYIFKQTNNRWILLERM